MDNTDGDNLQALRVLGERLAGEPAFAELCTRLGAMIAERAVLNQGVPMPAALARGRRVVQLRRALPPGEEVLR